MIKNSQMDAVDDQSDHQRQYCAGHKLWRYQVVPVRSVRPPASGVNWNCPPSETK